MTRLARVLAILVLMLPSFVVAGTPARAVASNYFCAASLYTIPWNPGADAPLASSNDAYYAVQIYAAAKKSVQTRVTFITGKDAWSATLPSSPVKPDATGKDAAPAPVLVEFPKAIDVRYAYVDAVGIDGGAMTNCPSVVQQVNVYQPRANGSSPHLGSDVAKIDGTFLQKLPPLSCGSVYKEATVRQHVSAPISAYAQTKQPALVDVFVDSTGRVVSTKLARSSGIAGVDANAIASAQATIYNPAMFLCVPVVSEVVWQYTYTRE